MLRWKEVPESVENIQLVFRPSGIFIIVQWSFKGVIFYCRVGKFAGKLAANAAEAALESVIQDHIAGKWMLKIMTCTPNTYWNILCYFIRQRVYTFFWWQKTSTITLVSFVMTITVLAYDCDALKYKKRLLLRCIHHFKSDLINNMDHIAHFGYWTLVSDPKPNKVVNKWLKIDAPKVPKYKTKPKGMV